MTEEEKSPAAVPTRVYKIGESLQQLTGEELVGYINKITALRTETDALHKSEGRDPYSEAQDRYQQAIDQLTVAFKEETKPFKDKLYEHATTMAHYDYILSELIKLITAVNGDEFKLPENLVKDGKFTPLPE